MQNHKAPQNQAPVQSPVKTNPSDKAPNQNANNFPQSSEKDNN